MGRSILKLARSPRLRVAVAGGGTGGHVFPALAVAEAIRERHPDSRVLFLGAKGRIDESILAGRDLDSLLLNCPRPELGVVKLPAFCAQFGAAVAKAMRALARFRPHVVIGAGGYASAPAAIAAKAVGAKLVILEQNAIPGRANRLLARIANEVHTQFTESAPRFPAGTRVRVTGNPVRPQLLDVAERRMRRRRSQEPFTLLVMGGSQGARSLNAALWDALPRLGAAMPRMRVYHCAGRADEDRARARLFASGLSGRSWGFCRNMHDLYTCAALVLARAGATSIAELSAAGLPSILIPYPHARDDHQTANARVLAARGACEVVADNELNGRTLAEAVLGLARNNLARERMAHAAAEFARPAAAERVAMRVEALAGFARPTRIAPVAAVAATRAA